MGSIQVGWHLQAVLSFTPIVLVSLKREMMPFLVWLSSGIPLTNMAPPGAQGLLVPQVPSLQGQGK